MQSIRLNSILLSLAFLVGLHAAAQPEWVENRGQWPSGVAFQTKVNSGILWTETTGFRYQLYNPEELSAMHNMHGAAGDAALHGHNYK